MVCIGVVAERLRNERLPTDFVRSYKSAKLFRDILFAIRRKDFGARLSQSPQYKRLFFQSWRTPDFSNSGSTVEYRVLENYRDVLRAPRVAQTGSAPKLVHST